MVFGTHLKSKSRSQQISIEDKAKHASPGPWSLVLDLNHYTSPSKPPYSYIGFLKAGRATQGRLTIGSFDLLLFQIVFTHNDTSGWYFFHRRLKRSSRTSISFLPDTNMDCARRVDTRRRVCLRNTQSISWALRSYVLHDMTLVRCRGCCPCVNEAC